MVQIMRAVGLNLFLYNSQFVLGFKTSHISRSRADGIVVELLFEGGVSGWGESVPRSYVTGETLETVVQFFKETVAPILFQTQFDHVKGIEQILNLAEGDCLARKFYLYNSGLGALEIALLDALGRMNQVPFLELIGPSVRERIPYSISVPLVPLETIKQGYELVKDFDLKHVKVLMTSDAEANYDRVSCTRSLFGHDANVRVDANGNWTVQQALANIDKLKPLEISAIEQPVAASDLEGLREIRIRTGLPVVADESLCSLEDAERLVAAEACDIMNIKISKCGGVLRSRKIAEYADSHGIPCQLGSHVGETPILHRAGECFALTTRNISFYEGCSPLLFGSDLINGQVNNNGSGLGVHIDKKSLKPILSLTSDV